MKEHNPKTERILILCAFFLSGVTSLAYEVTWIKPITFVLSSTTYVLTVIVSAFMLGLALGGLLVHHFKKKITKPARFYAYAELGIGVYSVLLLSLFNILPRVFGTLSNTHSVGAYFSMEFSIVFLLLLIPTVLMGTTLPLMASLYKHEEKGRKIGNLYTINNIGAVLGSLLAGFWWIPYIGITSTITILSLINILIGVSILIYFENLKKVLITAAIVALIYIPLSSCGGFNPTDIYTKGVCGAFKKDFLGNRTFSYYEEGIYGPVVIMDEGETGEVKRLLINGQGSSSLRLSDVRVSTLLGYLPLLVNPQASSTLVIGFGTGATSGILSTHTKTTTAEIEPKVIKAASYFSTINNDVINNPNHTVVYNDGRNYLLKTQKTFDIIVNHPLEPYQSASSILFTKDFYEVVRQKLNPDGVYVQWLPIYDLGAQDIKNVIYTLKSVFPHLIAYGNVVEGEFIDYHIITKDNNDFNYSDTITGPARELIIVASDNPISASEIEKKFETLTPQDKAYLHKTSLDTGARISNLYRFSSLALPDSDDSVSLITDDKPSIEFTSPFNKIRGRAK